MIRTTRSTPFWLALGWALLALWQHPATAADAAGGHRGGKLRLVSASSGGTIDPQVNYTLQFAQMYAGLYDGLVGFKKASGAAAFTLVPDLAEALPQPTDGGRTYTFVLRQGIKFSNGKELTVDDVKASFQRLFKVNSPTADTFYGGIEGASECVKARAACTLAKGVVVDPQKRTVTFHLVRPDSEFFDKLAFNHAFIVPADTPPRDLGVDAPAGTGAYMVASYDPKKSLRMVRNPYFKQWSADAQPDGYVDEIDYDFGLTNEDETTAVANGQADWMFDSVPADRLGELGRRYQSQVHLTQLTALHYIAMNSHLAPFDNPKVREAVNLAIDRVAATKLYGGANLATPSCQILPPGIAGYEPYCPWTKNPGTKWTAPDMERAKELVKESGTAGQKVTFIAPETDIGRAAGTYMQDILNQLGYQASLKVISQSLEFTYIQNTKNQVQISYSDWYQDFPAASDFLEVLFSCASFHPGTDESINIAGVCDKNLDAEMAKAHATAATDPKAAAAIWADIDRKVTDAAYFAVLYNPKHIDFVSKRLGNFTFSGQTYFLPALAWVQ